MAKSGEQLQNGISISRDYKTAARKYVDLIVLRINAEEQYIAYSKAFPWYSEWLDKDNQEFGEQLLDSGKVPAKKDLNKFIDNLKSGNHVTDSEDAELVTRFEMQKCTPDILICIIIQFAVSGRLICKTREFVYFLQFCNGCVQMHKTSSYLS